MLDKIKTLKKRVNKGDEDAQSYVVALDIGTEYIKALVGRVDGDKVEIIGVGRARQGLQDMQAGAIADIAAVVGNCDRALSQAEEQAGVTAHSVVIGIAGELVKGTATTVKITRKDPNKAIDADEIEQMLGIVQSRAEKQARADLSTELGGKDMDIRLVNSALVSIEIDGYKITNPLGFQGREVTLELYTAFAPLVHIGALEKVAEELDLELVAVAAEPFAVARSVIGNDPDANMSAILMDIGGGTTDIAVVNEGGVEGTKMFGIGGRAFTRSIERELGLTFDQAEAVKLALETQKVPEHKKAKAMDATRRVLTIWQNGIELALGEFDKLDHLPHQILLCGGGSGLAPLLAQLTDSKWYTSLPFTRRPVIKHISPDLVVGIVDKTSAANDYTYITAMGLLRVALDTMGQGTQDKRSLKDRFNKLLKV